MKLSNKIGIFSLIIAVIGILVTAEFRSLYYSNNDITNNSFSKLSGDKKPIAIYIKKAYEAVSNNKLTIPSKYSAIYYARILKKLYPKDKVSKKIAIDIVRKYILLSEKSIEQNNISDIVNYLKISKKIIIEFGIEKETTLLLENIKNSLEVKYPLLNLKLNDNKTLSKNNILYGSILTILLFFIIFFTYSKLRNNNKRERKRTEVFDLKENSIISDIRMKKEIISFNISGCYTWRYLSTGGWGTIYFSLENNIAIKILIPKIADYNPLAEKEFEREFFILQELKFRDEKNKSIINTYDKGMIEGKLPYYTMEFVNGIDLAEILGSHGFLSDKVTIRVIRHTIRILHLIHSYGYVYRDVSPENIIFENLESKEIKNNLNKLLLSTQIKFIDFNTAIAVDNIENINPERIYGKLLYIPPEQWKGLKYEFSSDVYQLGILCYELLSGSAPFIYNTQEEMKNAHITEKVTLDKNNIPYSLKKLVEKMLEKEPKNRPTLEEIDNILFNGSALTKRYRGLTQIFY